MKRSKYLYGSEVIIGFIIGLIGTHLINHCVLPTEETAMLKTDTVTIHDTVNHVSLVPVRDTIVRYIKEKPVFIHDTTVMYKNQENLYTTGDSVIVPITQKEYTDDSTYHAWVSGYRARLDSIQTYSQRVFVTKTISVTSRKRWSWGLQGGLYLTPKGVQPGIGVGVTFGLP